MKERHSKTSMSSQWSNSSTSLDDVKNPQIGNGMGVESDNVPLPFNSVTKKKKGGRRSKSKTKSVNKGKRSKSKSISLVKTVKRKRSKTPKGKKNKAKKSKAKKTKR